MKMVEAKYYKDYDHNYMILKSEDTSERGSYKYRMLTSNKIDGLIKCSVRDINGEVYFYYDISSKVSVENLYKSKQLSYEQVRDFFIQMNTIYRNLGQFFMDEKELLTRPDCIFYDLSTKRYSCLYYPQKEDSISYRYEELMDFLLAHINNSDKLLADNIYQIYEMSENRDFFLTDALTLFNESDNDVPDIHAVIEESSFREIQSNEEYAKTHDYDDNSFLHEDPDIDIYDGTAYEEDGTEKGSEKRRKSSGRFYGFFVLASLIGICAAGWVYFNYKLTSKETMIILCCVVIMSLCLVFSLFQLMLTGKRTAKKEREDRELKVDIEDEFRNEKTRYESFQGEDISDESPSVKRMVLPSNVKEMTAHKEESADCGETVFIDNRYNNVEYKLYALDKKNKKHIELTQFPFTIGKMPGCVDCVLMDDSISRLHARIEKQNEKIMLTDMNSTNGTYKNGLRMEPSETVELEPGDEIRFGKLNYCYR